MLGIFLGSGAGLLSWLLWTAGQPTKIEAGLDPAGDDAPFSWHLHRHQKSEAALVGGLTTPQSAGPATSPPFEWSAGERQVIAKSEAAYSVLKLRVNDSNGKGLSGARAGWRMRGPEGRASETHSKTSWSWGRAITDQSGFANHGRIPLQANELRVERAGFEPQQVVMREAWASMPDEIQVSMGRLPTFQGIHGFVRDADDQYVNGMTVELGSSLATGYRALARQTTREDGGFSFPVSQKQHAHYLRLVSSENHGQLEQVFAGPEEVRLELEDSTVIPLRFTDPGGQERFDVRAEMEIQVGGYWVHHSRVSRSQRTASLPLPTVPLRLICRIKGSATPFLAGPFHPQQLGSELWVSIPIHHSSTSKSGNRIGLQATLEGSVGLWPETRSEDIEVRIVGGQGSTRLDADRMFRLENQSPGLLEVHVWNHAAIRNSKDLGLSLTMSSGHLGLASHQEGLWSSYVFHLKPREVKRVVLGQDPAPLCTLEGAATISAMAWDSSSWIAELSSGSEGQTVSYSRIDADGHFILSTPDAGSFILDLRWESEGGVQLHYTGSVDLVPGENRWSRSWSTGKILMGPGSANDGSWPVNPTLRMTLSDGSELEVNLSSVHSEQVGGIPVGSYLATPRHRFHNGLLDPVVVQPDQPGIFPPAIR